MDLAIQVSSVIFSIGFYIFTCMYALQLAKVIKTKNVEGLSIVASAGYTLLAANAVFYSYTSGHHAWMAAFFLNFCINLTTVLLCFKYRN